MEVKEEKLKANPISEGLKERQVVWMGVSPS